MVSINISLDRTVTLCSCNRTTNSLSWHNSGKIASAVAHGVSVIERIDRDNYNVVCTAKNHSNRTNCVQWVKSCELPLILISGGVDKRLNLYHYDDEQKKLLIEKTYTDAGGAIIALCGAHLNGKLVIASSSADSHIRIYYPNIDAEKAVQELKFGSGFILSLQFWYLGNDSGPMLACGGDDMKIHLFVLKNDQFIKAMSLIGHEDWIRSLNFTRLDGGDTLLATSAQDNSVRIWRFRLDNHQEQTTLHSNIDYSTQEIEMKKRLLTVLDGTGRPVNYSVTSESVLYGHEGWVYAALWHPPIRTGDTSHQPMKLLTASMDKTMIIWEPEEETGVWEELVRVGEVGGNTLGLYGCQFSPDGQTIMAHGYQGAYTVWNLHQQDGGERWQRGVVIGGHFSDVTDMFWDPQGEFVVTSSLDQTTRLFAPWKDSSGGEWYEMCRPQVHGYDIQCLALISRFEFASGADEKVVRVFRAPNNVLENLEKLATIDASQDRHAREGERIAEGASVPALGLSNKSVYQGEDQNLYSDREIAPSDNHQYSESAFRALRLNAPPAEDNLLQNTLWPETNKLYGHGYEIYSVAASLQHRLLASACKASKPEHAGIILWDTETWKQVASLSVHTLTVVQMEFSHSGDRLLSVSRDRTWALHDVSDRDNIRLVAHTDKKTAIHSRIIWSCAWSPDDIFFCTASRDKKIVIWQNVDSQANEAGESKARVDLSLGGFQAVASTGCADAVTAVDFALNTADSTDRYLVAAGLESGHVIVFSWMLAAGFTSLITLDNNAAHQLTVKRLRFRPLQGEAGKKDSKSLQLASCGSDHAVKIYTLTLTGS